MGRKGNWLSSVMKVFSPNSKKSKKASRSKSKSFEHEKLVVLDSPKPEVVELFLPPPPLQDVKVLEEVADEQPKKAYSVAAAEAAVAAAQAAAEVVQPTTVTQFAGKSSEEAAAIKIQTAFRGYLARRALRALRGLVRLKSLVDGPTVKRQTGNTLKCMQTLIQSRRLRMLEENRALQRQLLQKRAKEMETLRFNTWRLELQMGEDWDDSVQSKEQVEANLLQKYEAIPTLISKRGRNLQDLPTCCSWTLLILTGVGAG